ncbi:MAG: ABC transporter permease [bacterium]
MSFVLTSALKDWRRQRRDLAAAAIWLGLPIVTGSLMWLVSGGREGPKPQAQVIVADEDSTFASRMLVRTLESSGGLVHVESATRVEGRARIEKGKATALLVLPKGFGDAVFRETPVTLDLVKNPAQRILPEIVEQELRILIEAQFYAHRLIGDDLRRMAAGPPPGADTMPEAWIADFSVRVNRLVEQVAHRVKPLAIKLETVAAEEEKAAKEKEPSFAELFIPGLLVMSLFFAARGIASDVWQERDERTLRRVVTSPQDVVDYLTGKILFGTGMMLAISTVALAICCGWVGLAWSRLPVAVAWATFSGAVILAMMLLLQLVAPSRRAGEVITLALTFPLIMIGGSFFPFEAMPAWMVAIGRRTPNGWAVLELKRIFFETLDPASLATAFGAMLAMAVVLFAVGAWRLRVAFARE